MVKYGKEFRKNQITEWREKYLDYKMLKQLIKKLIAENSLEDIENNNNNNNKENDIEITTASNKLLKIEDEKNKYRKLITSRVNPFSEMLDKEIKKVFIFFVKEERTLYKDINLHLYQKEDYEYFELEEFRKEFEELDKISSLSLKLINFVFYNFKALMKILKKFDKKCFSKKLVRYKITQRYIELKLEDQNSDILYILEFKLIDEVGALLEDLIHLLKSSYERNKNVAKIEYQEMLEEKLLDSDNNNNMNNRKSSNGTLNSDDNENVIVDEKENSKKIKSIEHKIKNAYSNIKNNIKHIDAKILEIRALFKPWEQFIKISSGIDRKLYNITKETVLPITRRKTNKSINKENSNNNSKDINLNIDNETNKNDDDNNNNDEDNDDDKNDLNKSSITLFSDESALPYLYKKHIDILSNVNFTRENRSNIRITLLHTFIFMYSYAVSIPINLQYTEYILNKNNKSKFYNILISMSLPLGILLSYTYTTMLSKISTKKPLLLSTVFLVLGNSLYFSAFHLKNIYILLAGRMLIGMGGNRVGNKMYLVNYVPKSSLSTYLTYFHLNTVLGLIIGFFVNCIFIYMGEKKIIFNDKTSGAFIGIIICVLLLISVLIRVTEAHNSRFNTMDITIEGTVNMIQRGELGIGEISNSDSVTDKQKGYFPSNNNSVINVSLNESIKRDTLMVENTNNELDKFNQMNKYNDTNLVQKNIKEITQKAKNKLKYLKAPFIVFLSIIFGAKMLSEFLLVFTPVYISKYNEKKNNRPLKEHLFIFALISGFSQIFILILEYIYNLMKRNKTYMQEKTLIFFILLMIIIVNILELIFYKERKYILVYFLYLGLLIIFSCFLEKISNSFFQKIIPFDYKACCFQGNVALNIISNIGRIIGALIPILISIKIDLSPKILNRIIFGFIFSYMFYCLILMTLFYSDLRIKAINRILGKEEDDKTIKITNEF